MFFLQSIFKNYINRYKKLPMELFKKILWKERENCVFGSAYLIAGKEIVGMSSIFKIGRNDVVGHNHSRRRLIAELFLLKNKKIKNKI